MERYLVVVGLQDQVLVQVVEVAARVAVVVAVLMSVALLANLIRLCSTLAQFLGHLLVLEVPWVVVEAWVWC